VFFNFFLQKSSIFIVYKYKCCIISTIIVQFLFKMFYYSVFSWIDVLKSEK